VSNQRFVDFLRQALTRIDMPVLQLEQTTGDRVRDVLQGRQKPPLATLHKWAKALQLDDVETMDLYALADEAHGGGTIVGWMVEQLKKRDAAIDSIEGRLSDPTPLSQRTGRRSSWWDRLQVRFVKALETPMFKPFPSLPRAGRIVGSVGGHGNWSDPQLERRVGAIYNYDGIEVQHGVGRQLIPDGTIALVTARTPIRGDVVAMRIGNDSDIAYFWEQRPDAITVMDLADPQRLVDIPLPDIERMCVVAGVPWKQPPRREAEGV
jgi:hypothetical protein